MLFYLILHALYLVPLRQGLSLNWSSLFFLGSLASHPASKPQSFPLVLRFTAICSQTQLMWMMGIRTQVLMLRQKTLLPLNHHLSPFFKDK